MYQLEEYKLSDYHNSQLKVLPWKQVLDMSNTWQKCTIYFNIVCMHNLQNGNVSLKCSSSLKEKDLLCWLV